MKRQRWARAVLLPVALLLMAACGPPQPAVAHVIRRFHAPEASQAVGVDGRFFYAIADAEIGKYEKATGGRVGGWRGQPDEAITHLNSGIVIGRELYCAHSNYPHTPMVSSVEVFDTDRMQHLRSLPLPLDLGSATWLAYTDRSWWVNFANYSGKGGVQGKGSAATRLVRLAADWRPAAIWTFPESVVARWGTMSSSGGALAGDRLFYTTGHDAPEVYVLELPRAGRELRLRAIIRTESEGQGIALDPVERTLYSIQRRTREVLVSALPDPGR